MKTADMDHGSHMLPSRHLRSMHEKIGNEELHVLEFCQAAAPILEQVNKFRKHPVSWQGDGPGTGLPVGVMTALWNLVEHYAPGFLSHPGSQNPAAVTADASSPPSAGRTSCAMCCADMQSSNGTCDVCSTVKPVFNEGGGGDSARPTHTHKNSVTQGTVVANRLEHGVVRGEHEPSQNIVTNNILHPMYQAHHTVGGNTRGAPSPPPQRTHMECVVPMSEDASSHAGGGMRSSSAMVTSAGAVYQRRAQFRMALASCASRFLVLVENRHDTIRAAHRGSFHRQWWRVCVNSLRPPPHT